MVWMSFKSTMSMFSIAGNVNSSISSTSSLLFPSSFLSWVLNLTTSYAWFVSCGNSRGLTLSCVLLESCIGLTITLERCCSGLTTEVREERSVRKGLAIFTDCLVHNFFVSMILICHKIYLLNFLWMYFMMISASWSSQIASPTTSTRFSSDLFLSGWFIGSLS